ncbi:MAG: MATE family efflux transporter [Chitinophagaceae bacterium]
MGSLKIKLTGAVNIAKGFINKGHARSIEAKKNILASLFIKGCSIAVSLLLVPLTIGYINPAKYGIWLTMSSIVAWFSFFDIGFTQGLRNKFTEAKAKGNMLLARIYVSTTYYYVIIIFACLWVVGIVINQFINWHKVLKIPVEMEKDVSRLSVIILSYFCLVFIFRIINTLLIADQKPAKSALLDMLGQVFALVVIFALTKLTQGSLLYLALAIAIPTLLILGTATWVLFRTAYKEFRPSLAFVKKEHAKDILSLGVKFFVLQIASIVQYESILFLIAHYFDTTQVTAYNIAYKYFFTLQMCFMILINPLWSGVTDAYASGDVQWIKKTVNKYLLLLIPFVIAGFFMLLFSERVYNLWLGKNTIHINHNISLLCYIFFSTGMFASIFVFVINGIGALRVQFISSIITCIGFFVLALLFIKRYKMGIESILIASIIANVYGYIIAPLQYYQIFIRKSKAGIWYK